MNQISHVARSAGNIPARQVEEFIVLVRASIHGLISPSEWNNDAWEVGHLFTTKGRNIKKRILAFYNRQAAISSRQVIVGEKLHPLFIEFAKAYIVWMHATRPLVFERTRLRLDVLKLIETAFRDLGIDPAIENLNVAVLNRAVEIGAAGVGSERHYQFGMTLQQIHGFCLERSFLKSPFFWKHGVKKDPKQSSDVSASAKAWREKRLPSPEAFHALAEIFRHAETFQDRVFSAVCAICMSVPIRAHEALQMRENCEVRKTVLSSENGKMTTVYGLRIWPGKGHPPQVKWVPAHMATIVEEAVQRLRDMCLHARNVAAWYEVNPSKLCLPPTLEHFRATGYLPKGEVSTLVGMTTDSAFNWMKAEGIKSDRTKGVLLDDLAEKLLRLLPPAFPAFNGDADQTFSETLIVIFRNQLGYRGTNHTVVGQLTVDAFIMWLGGPQDRCVFTRWGFVERDGSPMSLGTHAFRHWLNTIAQLRGMSDVDIAKWSGRELSQNKAYNHVTGEEILSQIRAAIDDGNALGPMFEAARRRGVNMPVDRSDFIDAQIGSALVTDYGICVHDYSLLPCQSHGDCLGCSENVFVKGDADHKAKLERRLELSETQLSQAADAVSGDQYGADRWLASHERAVARQKAMIATHNDPSIADGTIVNLPDGALDNEVAMALRDREAFEAGRAPGLAFLLVGSNEADALKSMWED